MAQLVLKPQMPHLVFGVIALSYSVKITFLASKFFCISMLLSFSALILARSPYKSFFS